LFGVRDARKLQLKSPAQPGPSVLAANQNIGKGRRLVINSGLQKAHDLGDGRPTIGSTHKHKSNILSPLKKKKHIISIQTLSRWRAPIGPQPRLESVPSTEAMEAATPADATPPG